MNKIGLCFIMLLSAISPSFGQEFSELLDSAVKYYPYFSPEFKCYTDSVFGSVADVPKREQITSACGIEFGLSREDVEKRLRKKYGSPSIFTNETYIKYDNVNYANIKFNSLFFKFQSDGLDSYFNCCIFVKEAKDKKEVISILNEFESILKKKYDLLNTMDEFGFVNFTCGYSPLWNGHWYTLMSNLPEYCSAIHTDVIKYDKQVVKDFGNKYAVRIIYGPYQYIKEEF